jgi:hypothetical protein
MIRQRADESEVAQPQSKRQRLEARVREIVENPGEVLINGSNTSSKGFRKAVQRIVKEDEDSKNIYSSTSESSIKSAIKLCAGEFPTHNQTVLPLLAREHADIINDDTLESDDKFDQIYDATTNAMKLWLDTRLANMSQPPRRSKKSKCVKQMKEYLQKINDPVKKQQNINLSTMMTARFPNRINHVLYAKETLQTRHMTDHDDTDAILISFESGLSADLAFVAVKPGDSDHERIDPNNNSRPLLCPPIELKNAFTAGQVGLRRVAYIGGVFDAKNNDLIGIVDVVQLDGNGNPYPLLRLLITNIGKFHALANGNSNVLSIALINVQVNQSAQMITHFDFGETTQALLDTAVELNILTVLKRPDVADVWSNELLFEWLKKQPAPETPMVMGDIVSGSIEGRSGNVREQMLAKAILDTNGNLDRIRTPLDTCDPIDLLFRKNNEDDDEKHGDCQKIAVSSRPIGFANKNTVTPFMSMRHNINGQQAVPLTLENANDILCAVQPLVDDEETLTTTNSPDGTVAHIYVFHKEFVFGHAGYHGTHRFCWKLGDHLDKLVYINAAGETINADHRLFAF